MTEQDKIIREIQGKIDGYKQRLANTDYQSLKHSEGEMSDDEFAPIRQQRQEWRRSINELEDELKEIMQSY